MRTPKTWLSAVTRTRTAKAALLGFAAVGAAGAIALSPTAAQKVAGYVGDLQPNGYYCGPAATRIALSAHGHTPSFADIANDLHTTENGTSSIDDITRVLNYNLGGGYHSVEIKDKNVSPEQTDQLVKDVVGAVNRGNPVVANIAGKVTDTAGEQHSYEGGHYLTITGYTEQGHLITITDPADRVDSNEYQLPADQMAKWIGSRGYSA